MFLFLISHFPYTGQYWAQSSCCECSLTDFIRFGETSLPVEFKEKKVFPGLHQCDTHNELLGCPGTDSVHPWILSWAFSSLFQFEPQVLSF